MKVRNRITPAVAPGKPCSRKPRNILPVNKRYRYGAGNCPGTCPGSAAEATAVAPAAEGVVEGAQKGAAGFSPSAFMLLVSIPGGIPLTAEQQCVESGIIGQMLHHRGDSRRGPVNTGVATSGG